jgi:hypothetical protein
MSFRLKGALMALLALCAGNCLNANAVGVPRTEFRHVYSLSPNGHVVIENLYGDVSITAWDRDEVQVIAVKRSPDPRRLDDARIVVEPTSELLSIRTQYAGADAEHPASVDYWIRVPRSANLEDVKLINGGLSIIGMAGPVKASAVNGNIHADQLEGQAELSTVNGKVEADFHRINRANPISLSSVNGPIHLSIPGGTGANLVARNLSGGIESDFGHVSHATGVHRLVVKGSGAHIQLHNVNGGISIHSIWRAGVHATT